ncbi:hypothetical protein TNCT_395301 [Trichonephila clavata]|uniref:Uncharacterized protein n=1 Tax=Trichonephila clavata TaxID=2740835 RepID=A0A8X6G5P3_TRICU|nr:hypothetical protein TNCT_395301 [Trichonephila clavata]
MTGKKRKKKIVLNIAIFPRIPSSSSSPCTILRNLPRVFLRGFFAPSFTSSFHFSSPCAVPGGKGGVCVDKEQDASSLPPSVTPKVPENFHISDESRSVRTPDDSI